jgi:thioesterase domain-containing protein/acyl carrier protein
MIPAYFVHLEALPLNTSGKIDRRALPAPDTAVVNPPHLASRNQVEAQLPDICRQVLAADTVGLNDDFFRLGGNSLKVIKLIAEIHRVFGVEMPVFQVFRTPRIREIARFIVQGKYRLDREELYMVFNPPGDNLLFCFPPAVGYGLAYQELAARLPEYALYAFNYIGSQDLMERYVEAVIQAQPRGPVRLFGYSAGGKLCVRAARLLEQRGLEVADIILLDCARKRRELTPEEYETLSREFIHELETGLDGLGLGFMKEKVVDRLKRYDRYWDCLDDLQPVQADIHLIRAEEKGDDEAGQDWRDLTEGEYRVLRGSGPHRDMMKPPFLDQNAAVIRQLLSPQVVITPRIRSAHRRLSDYSLEFLKYVRRRPEALALSCYESLKSGDVNDELQPWPTFVGPALLRAIRQAAEGVSALIKTIPQKIFQNDARRMSDCYGSPLNLVQTQMQGLDDQYLAGLLGRGDFVLTAGGLKCLEFNMSANLGGLALPFWESLYLQTPVISRFITEQHIDIYNLNLLGLLFRHLIAAAAARGNPPGGELNIAVVLPKDETGSTGLPQQEAYLNAIYQETLLAVDRSLTGRVILTDYPHLRVADKGLRWRSQAIHVLVEMYHGVVPPEIFRLFQSGRLVLFNGPITGLLSNKLNLALLSEHRDSAAFNRQERAIIGNYIPWTRQIKATITTYRGEQVSLADLILDHRPELVIKPAVGFGGQDVFIGKFTSPRDWASLVDRALQQKKWLAQEYCDSLPLLYQTGGDGCRVHRGAWGFYVFGEKYAGGNVRLLPVHVEPGIVNVKQGAKASVIFEVAK